MTWSTSAGGLSRSHFHIRPARAAGFTGLDTGRSCSRRCSCFATNSRSSTSSHDARNTGVLHEVPRTCRSFVRRIGSDRAARAACRRSVVRSRPDQAFLPELLRSERELQRGPRGDRRARDGHRRRERCHGGGVGVEGALGSEARNRVRWPRPGVGRAGSRSGDSTPGAHRRRVAYGPGTSSVTTVGELALWVALLFAVWGSVAAFGGAILPRTELVESAVRSIRASSGMTALASLGLLDALLSRDLSLQYVVAHTTLNTPTPYLITAFWSGPAGAMLSFGLAVAACSVTALRGQRRPPSGQRAWVVGALSGVLSLILVALCFMTNPYDRVEWVPAEGQGLDPRLQTPVAAPYYAATYAAYGTAAIPFALAVGAVSARGGTENWVGSIR